MQSISVTDLVTPCFLFCLEKSVSPKDGTYEKIFWENFPNVGLSKVEWEQGFESGFQISLDPDPVSDRDPGAKKKCIKGS